MRTPFERNSTGFRREGGRIFQGERISDEMMEKLIEARVVATLPEASSAEDFMIKLEEENAKIIAAAGSELLHQNTSQKKSPPETTHKFGRNKNGK